MIVDDERFPLDCMANDIQWAEYGIQVVATKSNGREALESIPETQPDIIITDVRMPEMDGIELLKRVREQYPSIDTVIISGFEEFSYVKDAINLGAKNYILKPIDPAELLAAVLRVRDEREALRKKSQAEETYTDYLRCQMFACYTPEQANAAAERFSDPRIRCFRVVSALFDNARELLEGATESAYYLLIHAVRSFCSQNEGCYLMELNPHGLTLLLEGTKTQALDSMVGMLCTMVESKLRKHNYRMYAIGISETVSAAEQLCEGYLQAINAVNMRYIYGYGNVFRYGERLRLESTDRFLEKKARELNDSVVSDDESGIGVGIEAVTRALGAHGYSLEDIQRFARVTMTMLLERLSGFEVGLEEIYPAPSNIIMAICTCSSRREILRHLHVFLQTVATHITKCTHGGAKDSASVIKGYIERNFADEKLSSGTIAQELHFNSAYVSTLFSSNYGMTVTSYINQVRIANAARLLDETEDKVSTIARKVGYESRPYFCTVFKNIMGKTPSEYRAR